MRKIRVLRIIGQCKTGGTETIALNYYKNINHKKIGMDFLFYGKSLNRFEEELSKNGDKVINVVDYTEDLLGSIREIKDVVRKNEYDIVHAQLNALNFFPLLGAFLGGSKIRIASNHSTANLKYELKKSILKYLLRPTTRLMATSHRYFCQRALEKGKIKIIRNAIDLEKYTYSDEIRTSIRNKMGWNGKFVIGHGGRFTAQKNHKFIIEVFNEIHRVCPQAILVLAGDGHLKKIIEEYVDNLGLTNYVQFLGVRFDMNQLMQGMDVFLFPSLYEGFGNVITEAQAVGLQCVVSSSVPKEVKMTELVDFMLLNESANKWAQSILKYKNGYKRRNTHDELKNAGYEIKTAVQDLETYYISLVKE